MALKELPLYPQPYECIITKPLKKEYTTITINQNKLLIAGENLKQ